MLVFLSNIRWVVIVVLILVVVAVVLVVQVTNPAASITVSKETTYITEPLADDGLPDFEKYLLEKGFEGVTPENNAAVLLWRAFWPEGLAVEEREPMRQALGLDAGIDDEPSLVKLSHDEVVERIAAWLREQHLSQFPDNGGEADASDYGPERYPGRYEFIEVAKDSIELASKRPWTEEDFPPLAGWVTENQTPLSWIREASDRPRYYSPSPNFLGGQREGLMSALLPMAQNLRDGSRALSVETMWQLGEGRIEPAWRNTLTCFTLASFVSNDFSLFHRLVGVAIEGLACHQAAVLLHHGEPSADLAREMLRHLSELSALDPMVNAMNVGERLLYIDTILSFATGRNEGFADIELGFTRRFINWELVLEDGNDSFDRMVDGARISDRKERAQGIAELYQELEHRSQSVKQPRSGLSMIISEGKRSQVVSDILLSLLVPAIQEALHSEDRALTLRDMTKVAAALAVYRAEHGEYPESLEQLVPGILPEMPLDLFSDEPFLYRPMDDGGYLLYSVYENGIDNGGTDLGGEIVDGEWVADKGNVDRENCDLVFRVPVPAFELPSLSK